MKTTLIAGLIITAAIVTGLFFRFGTLSPCGALKQEFNRELMLKAYEMPTTDIWEQIGVELGIVIVGHKIDSFVDSLTPMQCTRALVRLHFEVENINEIIERLNKERLNK